MAAPNLEVTRSREVSGYRAAEHVVCDERVDDEGWLLRQFCFSLDEVACDATLAFFFSHQSTPIYLDGEEVYSLRASPRLSIIRTPGCSWAMISLYRENAGKEVLVELTLYYFGGRAYGLPFTLFALFLYTMSEGGHLFTGYIRQQHMLEEKETQLAMSHASIMMSRICSHFVFNILNAISGMCKYGPEKAEKPVVENAIKHGLGPKEEGGTIILRTRATERRYHHGGG